MSAPPVGLRPPSAALTTIRLILFDAESHPVCRAALIGTCRMNGVEPYAYLRDLFTRLANGHLEKDIGALMHWAYAQTAKPAGMSS